MTARDVRFRFRRNTAERWTELNIVLGPGEPGIETHAIGPEKLKFGDGVTPWNDLPYFTGKADGEFSNEELQAHVEDPTPHPVYEESGPNLLARYRSRKV